MARKAGCPISVSFSPPKDNLKVSQGCLHLIARLGLSETLSVPGWSITNGAMLHWQEQVRHSPGT
ncbi:hypothetical protein CCHR01_01397 [Colletotrichum chrysophilum]|uniref:Uncharacterized protein n=1 Tax=Colletotrichum chrysophilum TaxID=1836956 RepID=A0AAD9B0C1_9PEZI|nr:hypothetical protein CCHR01_01397 [Colletotrichum chrysophilum]